MHRREWLNLMTNAGEGDKATDKGHPSQGAAGSPPGELIALNPTESKSLVADVTTGHPSGAKKGSIQRRSKRSDHRAQKNLINRGWRIAQRPPKKLSLRQDNNAELYSKLEEICRYRMRKNRRRKNQGKKNNPLISKRRNKRK